LSRPLPSLSPEISPDAPERCDQPAQICDSMGSAPGGLYPSKEHKRALAQLTQPMPVQCWQLNHSRGFTRNLDLDTLQFLHQTRRSQSPPGGLNIMGTGRSGKTGRAGKAEESRLGEGCKSHRANGLTSTTKVALYRDTAGPSLSFLALPVLPALPDFPVLLTSPPFPPGSSRSASPHRAPRRPAPAGSRGSGWCRDRRPLRTTRSGANYGPASPRRWCPA
jgi:hypothetical protein